MILLTDIGCFKPLRIYVRKHFLEGFWHDNTKKYIFVREVMSSLVCWLAGLSAGSHKNNLMDFHETWMVGRHFCTFLIDIGD